MREREFGIDLVKIIACFGVIGLHTLLMKQGIINAGIAYMSFLSIPLFFAVNGYLMLQKDEITYKYVLGKIRNILWICLGWEILYSIAYFVYYGKVRNFVLSYILDFFQKGLFFHFWFLGSLIVLYSLLPIIKRLLETSVFLPVLIVLGLFSVVIDFLTVQNVFDLETIPQSLHFWMWLFYYMMGGWMARYKNRIKDMSVGNNTKLLMVLFALVLVWIWALVVKCAYGRMGTYGAMPIMIGTILIMLSAIASDISFNKVGNEVAQCVMGMYIIHPFVLSVLNYFAPGLQPGGSINNLTFWVLTIVISLVGTVIIRRIPVFKRMVRM